MNSDPITAPSHPNPFVRLYNSFTPASRAAILFVIPFTLLDAVHYYTAGTALLFSFPLVGLAYLVCGGLAAGFAHRAGEPLARWNSTGRSAGLRLWLVSTIINVLLAVVLGIASLGAMFGVTLPHLCLALPLHALGSVVCGWLGAWLYTEQYQRLGSR